MIAFSACALAASLALGSAAPTTPTTAAPLAARHQRWLDEEVLYIISDYERDAFLTLADNPGRDAFVTAFWEAHDPTPGTSINEFRDEHYRRIAAANKIFRGSRSRPGWKTERGKLYVQLGPPRDRQTYPFERRLYSLEHWFYQADPKTGLPPFFNVIFYKPFGVGDYELYDPGIHGPEKLVGGSQSSGFSSMDPTAQGDRLEAVRQLSLVSPELARASLSLIPGEPVDEEFARPSPGSRFLVARLESLNNRLPVDRSYVERLLSGQPEVSSEWSLASLGLKSSLHGAFIPSGGSALHYAIEVPPESLTFQLYDHVYTGALEIVGRIFRDARPVIQIDERVEVKLDGDEFERLKSFPLAFEDVVPLLPGRYEARLLVRNPISRQFGTVEGSFEIPERPPSGLALARPLIASFARAASSSGRLEPFALGASSFYPSFDSVVPAGGELRAAVQVAYAPDQHAFGDELRIQLLVAEERPAGADGEDDAGSGEPTAAGEARLSHFERVTLNPVYDHGIVAVDVRLPLGELPAGRYELRVSATHGPDDSAAASVPFEVGSQPRSRPPWITLGERPTDPSSVALSLGEQELERGDEASALAHFETAASNGPAAPAARLRLGELLIARKSYSDAARLLEPVATARGTSTYARLLLGLARSGAGDAAGAIASYEAAAREAPGSTRVLNALAEELLRAGEIERARALLRRSLELDPEQPDVRARAALVESSSATP